MLALGPLAAAPLASLPGLPDSVLLSDALALALDTTTLPRVVARSALALAARTVLSTEAHVTLADALALEERYTLIIHELLADSLGVGVAGSLTYTAIAHLADSLVLSGSVASSAEAHALIVDALAFATLVEAYPHNGLVDALAFSASLRAAATAAAHLVDALALADTLTHTATLGVLLEDRLAVGLTGQHSTEASALLRDALGFTLRLRLEANEEYVAWSMNTATKAASRYTNWPFNSSFKVGQTQFGVTDSGLYRIGGDSDAGEDIAAKLRLGLNALGDRVKKRIPSIYLAWRGNDLFLKVVRADNVTGAREAHVYRAYAQGAETTPRDMRRKLGRGLSAVFFDLVLENVEGGGFDLQALDFMPLYLERRIRGNAGGKP